MPPYAFPDKQSYDKMARVVRLRGGLEGGLPSQNVRESLPRQEFGKLDQAVTAGILTSPNNVVSIWKGPGHGVDDADINLDIKADYSFGDFDAGEYVLVTRHRSKWYVSCLEAPT